MMRQDSGLLQFQHTALPFKVLFGVSAVPALMQEIGRLESQRVLLICMPDTRSRAEAQEFATALGTHHAGTFAEAKVHVPSETLTACSAQARDARADLLVSIGGGSAIGLAKLVAAEMGVASIAIPTTYSGAEMTPFNAVTEDGLKTQRRDDAMMPTVVIYDIERSLGLPLPISFTSAMNALAHSVEALYAPAPSPIVTALAWSSVKMILPALPRLKEHATDLAERANLMCGSMLAGQALAGAAMALHHRICHIIGGRHDLGHAELNSVMLPYALAYNLPHARQVQVELGRVMDHDEPPRALHELQLVLGCPRGLESLGVTEDSLAPIARETASLRFGNPAPLEEKALLRMLHDAFTGMPPAARYYPA